jgi:hypothetical protein
MTQMGGVALLDYAVRFAPAERQSELIRHGYNSLLASWALLNCGDAAAGHGYWRKGAAFDGAAGWGFMPYPKGWRWKRQCSAFLTMPADIRNIPLPKAVEVCLFPT